MTSPSLKWDGPEDDHPARRASRNSYNRVVSKDKKGWLALWAADGEIHDPVGASFLDPTGKGHHGIDAIAAFWDAAIENVSISIHVKESLACGLSCANVVQFELVMGNRPPHVTEVVSVYNVNEQGLLVSMHAYWEPERMLAAMDKAQ